MEELKQWYDQISSFERLKIVDAQELYRKAINTPDEKQKKLYMDRLVLGTLYVVYEYIKRSNLELLTSTSYDMNDIISAFNEVWIKKIYSGDLLKVNKYSLIFTSTFLNTVCNILCGDEIVVNEQFGISADLFVELFTLYVELKNSAPNINFQNVIKEKYYDINKWSFFTYDYAIHLIPLLEAAYNNIRTDKEDIRLGKTKISNYIRLIINLGLVETFPTETSDNSNIEDNIIKEIMLEKFIEEVDQVLTNERMKKIIHERFGLDNNGPMHIDDVCHIHGITRTGLRQVENKALRKLRRSRNIQKYKEEF